VAGLVAIYRHLSAARRRHFFVVLGLMLVGALAELATIGSVLPFLGLLGDPAALAHYPTVTRIFSTVGANGWNEQLIAATVLFSVIVIASGAVRFELARSMQHFGYNLSHELMLEIERRFLFQPYAYHVEHNTSTLLGSLAKAEILVFEVLIPLMQALTALVMALFIISALIAVDPVTALVAAVAFTTMYVVVSIITKERLAINSDAVARGFDERLRILQESLDGIRDVIIDGSQSSYLELFDRENSSLNRARADTSVISSAPRFAIETVGILAIAAIALFESQRQGSLASALPVLGAIALGAQRLLPLVQQVYRGWSTSSGYLSVVGQTAQLLRLPIAQASARRPKPLTLHDKISIENVQFAYPTRRRTTLQDISFEIPAGSAVALVGETGSGKSTLADLLMGLIDPDSGRILVDGEPVTGKNRRRWQSSIAHVPQSIFLGDTTIARNIALGRPDEPVDLRRVIKAAEVAQLHEFVTSLPDGYETFVGEQGIRLSGGQRQRLGIARAIYKETPVLVLDEATSALDEDTEAVVMKGIHGLGDGRTLIIIAHRLSTITRCDRVVRLHEGRMVAIGTNREIVGAISKSEAHASNRR
jgi:ATP-binding cassette subfamily B protein